MTAIPLDPNVPIPGLMWVGYQYAPEELTQLAGPDQATHCEAPRHQISIGAVALLSGTRGLGVVTAAPPAAWVEMLWYPDTRRVARCWKTCQECHAAMAESHARL